MITRDEVKEIIKQFGTTEKDTGSAEVQVAILTKRITNLMPHFENHKHDFHSKRGLLKLIGQRKSLLKYVASKDTSRYQKLIKALGLRK